jgi:hypothetical protein
MSPHWQNLPYAEPPYPPAPTSAFDWRVELARARAGMEWDTGRPGIDRQWYGRDGYIVVRAATLLGLFPAADEVKQ